MANTNTVLIGCRLPNGIILHHPGNRKITVTIDGLNKSRIIGATQVMTEVPADFWTAWKAKNANFAPYKMNAIFEALSEKDANAIGKELEKEPTGFERVSKTAPSIEPFKA
jgi:hypothetical protein